MGYLSDYLTYSSDNEAPEMFHVWCGYAALSSAIGRRVWLPRGEDVVYPNIYVLLIGNAGCGKSYALYKSRRLIAELGNVQLSYSVETPEGLLRYMGGNPNADPPVVSECHAVRTWPDGQLRDVHEMTIVANEFIDFIRTNAEAWTGFLNNVFDEDFYKYRTKNMGTDVLVGPYVVVLGAIPTDVSKKLQDMDIINTGFARRTFMQYGERRIDNPKADPTFTQEEQDARDRCLEHLKRIQNFSGKMTRTPEAARWWKSWYDDHSLSILKRSTPATMGWLLSKPNQVVKLAILNSLSERDDLLITPAEYELGLAYINEMEKGFGMIFGGIGRNELAGLTMKVFEYLRLRNEPVGFKHLSTQFYANFTSGKGFSELTEILQYLLATDAIVQQNLKFASGLVETAYATPEAMAKFVASLREPPAAPSGEAPTA